MPWFLLSAGWKDHSILNRAMFILSISFIAARGSNFHTRHWITIAGNYCSHSFKQIRSVFSSFRVVKDIINAPIEMDHLEGRKIRERDMIALHRTIWLIYETIGPGSNCPLLITTVSLLIRGVNYGSKPSDNSRQEHLPEVRRWLVSHSTHRISTSGSGHIK